MIIGGRALQGVGGGGITVMVNVVVSDLFDLQYVHNNLPKSDTLILVDY